MSAQWLNGTALAKQLKAGLKDEVATFAQSSGVTPTLAVLRVGDDEASAGPGCPDAVRMASLVATTP